MRRVAATDLSPAAKGARRLRSVALALLAAGDPARGAALAKAQFDAADNMTDRQGALMVLASLDGAGAGGGASPTSTTRYQDDSLVLDKWFALQARGATRRHRRRGRGAGQASRRSRVAQPQPLRALVGNFAANQWAFHDASGRGYRFLADMILAVDRINPQIAARLVPPLGRWRRFEPKPRRADARRAGADRRRRRASARTCSSRRRRRLA